MKCPYRLLYCNVRYPAGGPVLETEVEPHWGQALRFDSSIPFLVHSLFMIATILGLLAPATVSP